CPTHLHPSPDGSQSVVLVQPGDAEHRHDGVADELLGRATVALNDGLHLLEVPAHQLAERLRIQRLPQDRRARDVREEDGHHLAGLGGRGLGHEEDPIVATASLGQQPPGSADAPTSAEGLPASRNGVGCSQRRGRRKGWTRIRKLKSSSLGRPSTTPPSGKRFKAIWTRRSSGTGSTRTASPRTSSRCSPPFRPTNWPCWRR